MCDHDHSEEGYKQLLDAVKNSKVDCVNALIRKGAGVKMPYDDLRTAVLRTIRNWQKNFPANDARWKVDFEILVSLFIECNCFEDDREMEQLSSLVILNMSALTGLDRCLQKVIDAGVDPDAPFEGESRALMSASSNGYINCVNILLKAGADVNAQMDNISILMCTAGRGWHECLKALLQAGAYVNFVNSHGFTALQFAVLTDVVRKSDLKRMICLIGFHLVTKVKDCV